MYKLLLIYQRYSKKYISTRSKSFLGLSRVTYSKAIEDGVWTMAFQKSTYHYHPLLFSLVNKLSKSYFNLLVCKFKFFSGLHSFIMQHCFNIK